MAKKLRVFLLTIAAFFVASAAALTPVNFAAAEDSADSSTSSEAAVRLQIAPVSMRIVIVPDQALEYNFTVTNSGSSDFRYKVYANPYSVTSDTYDLSFSNQTSHTQISRWVTFKDASGNWVDSAEFSIPAGESQIVDFRVAVPSDIPDGGQYATIFAESLSGDGSSSSSSTSIKTTSRVGMVLYAATSGETKNEASITDYNVSNFLLSGNITAGALVHNTGNTDFNVDTTVRVSTIFGKNLYENQSTLPVLPDTSRKFSAEWANTPSLGIFSVTYTVSTPYATEDHTTFVLIVPIFVLIIALLLLTLVVVWTIILIKKHKERRSRLLV